MVRSEGTLRESKKTSKSVSYVRRWVLLKNMKASMKIRDLENWLSRLSS